uniref:Uncharacterized protein n=1 Tax=Candidatus Kentrum sp. SD TaxID=2126332 RepID=A0A451BM37_9GAMM|nr:MAG: hypothetical protein BECKSD772F_GA0070984_105111 [Candidatus Kentron sp. SD]VFK45144.1 MAG: hypothetical protein BECKSD772E_GA0070983_10499 [Candidatus Kentron sp. SD]VFK79365.1 MAG: hypothetical protein BECKSD772D_GA0070982_104618 [Candidatus Kentron sp. SD]
MDNREYRATRKQIRAAVAYPANPFAQCHMPTDIGPFPPFLEAVRQCYPHLSRERHRLAKRSIQYPLRVLPTGFVLQFAASGQDTVKMNTGFHATGNEVTPEHHVLGSFMFHQ